MSNTNGAWDIPAWPSPWEPEFDVAALKELAQVVQDHSPEVVCSPDFSIEGCAFVQFYRDDINIGRACVGRHASGSAFYSAYLGATGDEFHGSNLLAIARIADVYRTSIDDVPELRSPSDARS